MRDHFLASAIGSYIGPGQTISGFLFTNLSRGVKPVNVDLIAPQRLLTFYFTIRVFNLDVEHSQADIEHLYPPGEIRDVGEAEEDVEPG